MTPNCHTIELDQMPDFPSVPFPTKPGTVTIKITPALAEAWLGRGRKNRTVSQIYVHLYANDMRNGEWGITGEPIKFDWDGAMIDGQHRLLAIIESGVSIVSDVRLGLDPAVFINMDTGQKRCASHFLTIAGETNTAMLGAALGNVLSYQRGYYRRLGMGKYTHNEIASALVQHPTIRDSVSFGRATTMLLPPGLGTALHYLATRVNKDKADLFWKQLETGAGLTLTSPVYLLRERLSADRAMASKRGRARSVELSALVIKSFNSFVEGKPMRLLRWSSQGKKIEEFPVFIREVK